MGNLIIKGKGGAGNKLILQDQAGGAVITTADSGATIANATLTAPTVASMANFTFPAGHIIQTIESINTYSTAMTSTAYTDVLSSSGTTWEPSITTSSSSSKVLVIFHLSFTAIRSGAAEGRGHYEIHQKIGGAGYVSMLQQTDALGTYDYGVGGIWSSAPITLNRLFAPASEAVIKYKVRMAGQSSVTVRCGPDSTAESQRYSFVTLMEVAG